MRALILVAGAALALSACDDSESFSAPVDNSPLAPEIVCEEPVPGEDSQLVCERAEEEVAEEFPVAVEGN